MTDIDLGLPDMGGIEVIKRIREWPKIPIHCAVGSGVLSMTVLQIHGDQQGVVAAPFEEFFMAALFDNSAVRHDNYVIGTPDSR